MSKHMLGGLYAAGMDKDKPKRGGKRNVAVADQNKNIPRTSKRRVRLTFSVVNPRIAEIWREFLVRWSSSQANLFIMRKINRKEEVRQTMLSVRVAPTHLLPAGKKKVFPSNWRHAQ